MRIEFVIETEVGQAKRRRSLVVESEDMVPGMEAEPWIVVESEDMVPGMEAEPWIAAWRTAVDAVDLPGYDGFGAQ